MQDFAIGQRLIITNNIRVKETYGEQFTVLFLHVTYLEVLIAVRDHVHEGFRLLTHPLAGSMKPNQTPYRSILLEKGAGLDCRSVELIENCILTAEKFQRNRPTPDWNEKCLRDFRTVDLSFLKHIERVSAWAL